MTSVGSGWSVTSLWLAVVASGLYHGLNPGMGWPLAVSAGLMERSSRALLSALACLAVGHLLAMLVTLLPFAMLVTAFSWQREIRITAAVLLIAFGALLLMRGRHPRLLARIPPAQLVLWSFAVALAHGAGLMLLPIYLGLCSDAVASSSSDIAGGDFLTAIAVSIVHMAAMIMAGGVAAWVVYRYVGLAALSRSWFNLDRTWALSLILVGVVALFFAGH